MEQFYTLPQLVGYAAMALTLYAFSLKHDGKMRATAAAAYFIWTGHYALIGDMTAAGAMGLIGLRNAISSWIVKLRGAARWAVAGFFIACFSGVTWLTWHGWSSLMPLVSSINSTIAFLFMSRAGMRRQLILSDFLLTLNAINSGSVGGMFTHSMAIVLHGITAYRLDKAAEKEAALAAA